MSRLVREVSRGTGSVFLAESLAVPAGLLIVALLSRSLGPDGYGRYGLAVAIVSIVEWLIVAAFSRIAIIVLSDPAERDGAEPAIIRSYLFTALAAMAGMIALSPLLAVALHSPGLRSDLLWLSVDIPLFALTQAQRSIVTALGSYRGRAAAIGVRWISRLLLTWLFISAGMGVTGALLAWPTSSIAELACLRRIPWGSLWRKPARSLGIWRACRAPFLFAVGQRLTEKLDILALQAFSAPAATTGVYVAAQNLSILPGLFAASLSPVLMAAMTRERALGRELESREAGAMSLRVSWYTLPLAVVFGSCGPEISAVAFGPEFRPAGLLTGWLVAEFSGIAVSGAAASILGSQGRLHWLPWLSIPVAVLAGLGHVVAIPWGGMIGAAMVSAGAGVAAGLYGTALVYRTWRQPFPLAMVLRVFAGTAAAAVVGSLAGVAALAWPLRAVCVGVTSMVVLLAAGEWRAVVPHLSAIRVRP